MEKTGISGVKPATNTTGMAAPDITRSVKAEQSKAESQGRMLIGAGLVGIGLAAFCCAPPLFVALLPAIGLDAWFAATDRMLVLSLFVILGAIAFGAIAFGVIAFGVIRRRVKADACCETQITNKRC